MPKITLYKYNAIFTLNIFINLYEQDKIHIL